MINPSRGEVEIDLDGKKWPMRPELQTLRAIEHKTGVGATELAFAVVTRRATLDQIITVLELGLAAANDESPGFDEIGEILMHQGTESVRQTVVAFLGSVGLGDDAKKLLAPKGTETMAKTEPAAKPATDAPSPGGA